MISSREPSRMVVEQSNKLTWFCFVVLFLHLLDEFYSKIQGDIMANSIRRKDSLDTSVVRLRTDMKTEHGKYSDYVSDLAFLTKSELQPVIKSLIKKLISFLSPWLSCNLPDRLCRIV